MGYEKHYEAIELFRDFLNKDFVGPVMEDEVIDETPQQYYAAGILYPQGTEREVLIDDEETKEYNDQDEDYDVNLVMGNSYNPSAMAITTTVKADVHKIKVITEAAFYSCIQEGEEEKILKEQIISDDENEGGVNSGESDDDIKESKKKKFRKTLWKRNIYKWDGKNEFIFNLSERKQYYPQNADSGLQLQLRVQKIFDDGTKIITVALVNKNKTNGSKKINNENSYFQCKLELTSADGKSAIFTEKKSKLEIKESLESKTMRMLYSHVKNYAVGHSCSVNWEENGGGATRIESIFLPEYELRQMMPAIKSVGSLFNMKYLSEGSRSEICNSILRFVKDYESWIDAQKTEALDIADEFGDVIERNLNSCYQTMERINKARNLLLEDDFAFKAFQLANRAMLNQRISSLKRRKANIDESKINWYPFQLAFLLQEVPSLANSQDPYRKAVDLLWFPTGGGKTEAYLGITAFIIFLRRLRNIENGGGVTVIMRYTLRLLTIQQFERAAALICACETIRKTEGLGGDKISIGLWVGAGMIPNKMDIAKKNLEEVKEGKTLPEGDPCKLKTCPVCGAQITPESYIIRNNKELIICCSNNFCEYSEGLPVYLVDEEIYDKRPTLVLSTVDKFARMTWEQRIGELFGLGTKCPPPELIIQDELHLISGPLGTITGLYEMAIQKFCERNNIGAKIIASTATIKNADNQIRLLYGRELKQFPPQGINIRNSYFAVEADKSDKPTRKYIGTLSPALSSSTAMIRTFACSLFVSRYLKDRGFEDSVIDSFWTITGYFNCLRDLGGSVIQTQDDVQKRFKFLYTKKFALVQPAFTSRRKYNWLAELTSRKSASEINDILNNLELKYTETGSYHFVLASNMISVGIDIGRLGLMIMTGQPKSNAEYIQASSRVGRENPGVVIIKYNPAYSRDRSHYEQFKIYHSALYKYVESTSLTPFSERAREKALHAVFISMCRHLVEGLKGNDGASKFDISALEIKQIKEFIINYVKDADPREAERLEEHLEEIAIYWSGLTDEKLVYHNPFDKRVRNLICDGETDKDSIGTLNSMRNVDSMCNIYLEED